MYRITFVLDLFKGEDERKLSHDSLKSLLLALMHLDCLYLREHPEVPLLFDSGVRYQEEPPGQEDWQDIPTTLKLKIGDCLPLSTLVLRANGEACEIGSLVPGDVIMGDGVPTRVIETAVTGEKDILAFDLDNGCTLRCSPEHKLFLQSGNEVRARDVRVGDRLKSPSSPFPFAETAWQPDERFSAEDLAWLVGVYAADGWQEGSRFAISGDDETPKRGKVEQKDRVEAMMSKAGISTRRAKKYISVLDRPLTAVMETAGSRAPNKQVPSLLLTEAQVRQMISGLRADSSVANSGTITHGTVSEKLALQLRVLYRMLGQSVHIRRWDNHGGLGQNPIYRVTVHEPANDGMPLSWQTRAKNSADSTKVRAIRECAPEMCCDIETDTGRFYLPESDVVVHNCEDLACWRAAELRVRHNIMAEPTFIWKKRENGGYLYHILVRLPDGRVEDPSRTLGMR